MPPSNNWRLWPCLWVLSLGWFWNLAPFFAPLAAYELKSQRFVPDRYYIGQRVYMVLEIEVPPGKMLPLGEFSKLSEQLDSHSAISKLPNNLNYRIYQVNISSTRAPGIYAVELNYAVFTTDVSRLGSFEVAGFTVEALTIPRALSSLTQNNAKRIEQELPSLESTPLSLPWVDLSIAFLIQVLVLLPILFFRVGHRLHKWLKTLYQNFRQRKPYRHFVRQLYMLQQTESLSSREYYRILSSQVRYYLGQRTVHSCSAYTTEELANLNWLPLREAQELWQQVLVVLQAGDDVRFGTTTQAPLLTNREKKQEDVATILHFARLVEKQFWQGETRRV